MNSREKILAAVRDCSVPEVALPDLEGNWNTFADPREQFMEVLVAVGGRVMEVPERSKITDTLEQIETFPPASRVWSLVPDVDSAGGHWDQVTDPHDLQTLDYCIVPAAFGVAENGAVWVSNQAVPHRAALFITQHLVLVLDSKSIVHNMHQAYDRISFDQLPFGIFISGPSKTADIEQSLVIGAHGPRSLTVLLVDGWTG
jgi:L-lactate dehydrogenase complex protein LldG